VEEVASSYVGIGGERRGGVSFDIDIFSDIRRAGVDARFRLGRDGALSTDGDQDCHASIRN
jgi:hypothetical protein